jgi:toxin HigB-1
MRVEFEDSDLDRLETDASFTMGHSAAIVRAYRLRMQTLRSAKDERDLYAFKSLRFEKLKGQRQHQRSIRLNDQFRLILELHGSGAERCVLVVAIEDYH